jgi:hypothetical protein
LNIFLHPKDWIKCEQYFTREIIEENQILDANECRMLFVIHGEISIHFVSPTEFEDQSFAPDSLIKTLTANDFSTFFDLNLDPFSKKRSCYMRIFAASGSEYLALSQTNLSALLKELNSQEFSHFIQAR